MRKPSVEQIAWLFKHLCDHLEEGGNFLKMTERLGLTKDAFEPLMKAGAVEVTNILDWSSNLNHMVGTIMEDYDIQFTPETGEPEVSGIGKEKKNNGPN